MTVIAWDGTTLAADKRAISGGGICRTVKKIERFGECLLAISGSWDTGIELREWFKQGAVPKDFPDSARKDEATLLVIGYGNLATYAAGPYPMPVEDPRYSLGSGRDFAEAAMYLGKTAREAVDIACIFQSDCGNGINEIVL